MIRLCNNIIIYKPTIIVYPTKKKKIQSPIIFYDLETINVTIIVNDFQNRVNQKIIINCISNKYKVNTINELLYSIKTTNTINIVNFRYNII